MTPSTYREIETERRRDLAEVQIERAVGESKMQKWVAGLLAFKPMEFIDGLLCMVKGKGKRKNNQKRTADRQSRKAGSGRSEGIKS